MNNANLRRDEISLSVLFSILCIQCHIMLHFLFEIKPYENVTKDGDGMVHVQDQLVIWLNIHDVGVLKTCRVYTCFIHGPHIYLLEPGERMDHKERLSQHYQANTEVIPLDHILYLRFETAPQVRVSDESGESGEDDAAGHHQARGHRLDGASLQ